MKADLVKIQTKLTAASLQLDLVKHEFMNAKLEEDPLCDQLVYIMACVKDLEQSIQNAITLDPSNFGVKVENIEVNNRNFKVTTVNLK
jgi:hypothetical protein